jgi:putative Mn2+ efflux pump MntP
MIFNKRVKIFIKGAYYIVALLCFTLGLWATYYMAKQNGRQPVTELKKNELFAIILVVVGTYILTTFLKSTSSQEEEEDKKEENKNI